MGGTGWRRALGEGACLMPAAQVWVLFQSAAGPVHCFISRVLQGRPPPHPSDGEPHLLVPKLLFGLISCTVYCGSISVHGVGGLSPSPVLQSGPHASWKATLGAASEGGPATPCLPVAISLGQSSEEWIPSPAPPRQSQSERSIGNDPGTLQTGLREGPQASGSLQNSALPYCWVVAGVSGQGPRAPSRAGSGCRSPHDPRPSLRPDPPVHVLVWLGARWPLLWALVAEEPSRWMEATVPSSPAPCPPSGGGANSRDMHRPGAGCQVLVPQSGRPHSGSPSPVFPLSTQWALGGSEASGACCHLAQESRERTLVGFNALFCLQCRICGFPSS